MPIEQSLHLICLNCFFYLILLLLSVWDNWLTQKSVMQHATLDICSCNNACLVFWVRCVAVGEWSREGGRIRVRVTIHRVYNGINNGIQRFITTVLDCYSNSRINCTIIDSSMSIFQTIQIFFHMDFHRSC